MVVYAHEDLRDKKYVGLCDKKYLRSASFTNLLDDRRSTGHLNGTPTF